MGPGEHLHEHGAVMFAVPAAADGESGIGVLSESKRRRDDRQGDGCKQDEAEKTTHGFRPDGHSLRAGKMNNKRAEPKIGPNSLIAGDTPEDATCVE